MAYWLTEQDPFLSERANNHGVWVRPGKEEAAEKLAVGPSNPRYIVANR